MVLAEKSRGTKKMIIIPAGGAWRKRKGGI